MLHLRLLEHRQRLEHLLLLVQAVLVFLRLLVRAALELFRQRLVLTARLRRFHRRHARTLLRLFRLRPVVPHQQRNRPLLKR